LRVGNQKQDLGGGGGWLPKKWEKGEKSKLGVESWGGQKGRRNGGKGRGGGAGTFEPEYSGYRVEKGKEGGFLIRRQLEVKLVGEFEQ